MPADEFIVLVPTSAEWWLDQLPFSQWLAWLEIREALRDDATPSNDQVEDLGGGVWGVQHRGVLVTYEFVRDLTINILHVMRTFRP